MFFHSRDLLSRRGKQECTSVANPRVCDGERQNRQVLDMWEYAPGHFWRRGSLHLLLDDSWRVLLYLLSPVSECNRLKLAGQRWAELKQLLLNGFESANPEPVCSWKWWHRNCEDTLYAEFESKWTREWFLRNKQAHGEHESAANANGQKPYAKPIRPGLRSVYKLQVPLTKMKLAETVRLRGAYVGVTTPLWSKRWSNPRKLTFPSS